MYKHNPQNKDQVWRTWCTTVDENQVYQCREDIKCASGKFERGSLVLLQVLRLADDTDGKIMVTDFNAYGKRMISDHCNYFTKSELQFNISDVITLSLEDFKRLFEPVQEINNAWNSYKLRQACIDSIWSGISIGLSVVLVALIMFSFICFELYDELLGKQVGIFSLIAFLICVLICIGGALATALTDMHQVKRVVGSYISKEI